MVTAVPITARATPVSKIVAVASSVFPKMEDQNIQMFVLKRADTKKTSPIPVNMAIKTPSAATFLKLNGMFFLMVSISNARNKSVIPDATLNPPINLLRDYDDLRNKNKWRK